MMLLPVLLLLACCALAQAGEQSVRVTGFIRCHGYAYEGVRVQLWEEDQGRGAWMDPDDMLDETHSATGNGAFTLEGHGSELLNIRPYLLITHNCRMRDAADDGCHVESKFYVPAAAINQGLVVEQEFHMGNVELPSYNSKRVCK